MNNKMFNKVYSTFLVFLLSISLITTPLQTISHAEALDDEESADKLGDESNLEENSADDEADTEEIGESLNPSEDEKKPDKDESNNKNDDSVSQTKDNNKESDIEINGAEPKVDTEEENDYSDFEVEFDENETTTTSNSITVTWSVNYDIVDEFILSLNDEEVDIVSGDTNTYTFTDLKPGEDYDIGIEAKTKHDDVWYNSDYIWETAYWSEDELIPVSIITLVNEDPYYERIRIRGLDEDNRLFEEINEYLDSVDKDIELPIGNYEIVIYHEDDYSIAARKDIEIKEGIDYINNPIQLKFKLKEMHEEAEPFEYEVSKVTDNSFTLTWNEVSKITGFKIHAWNNKDEYFEIDSDPIDKDATEFTLKGLSPDLIYSVQFIADYLYDLDKWNYLTVKTDGEHRKAEKVDFENDALHKDVKSELGIHFRDATVADMEDLESLDISSNDLKTLKGLDKATNLQYLYAYYNNLSDLSMLSNFTKLVNLDLDSNTITDINPLKGLVNLDYLFLGQNNIQHIDALTNLTNLESLTLDNNKINDISALGNLHELEYLSFYGNKVNNISALKNLSGLYDLNLAGNEIEDISILANLTSLEYLYASDNNISILPSLNKLVHLSELSLYNNNITNISGLSDLNNLTYLDLDYNNISDISALNNLTNLETLYLYENNITVIPSLVGLESLTYLNLSNNNITDLVGLSGLNNLQELDLDNNNITDISVLKELPSLHYVSLYGNDITDEETIQWLLNDGVEVYYDDEDNDWNDWEDEDEWEDEENIIIDREEVLQSFPEEDGFIVSEDGKDISVDLNKVSSKDKFKLTEEQIKVLTENNQTLELNKGEVKTSIPSSAFDKSDEPVEITINEIESDPNSLSSTYDFTIKQGTRTISEFDKGVTLTFNVNADRAKNPNNMKVFYLNEKTGKWENIGGQYNRSNGTVTVVTAHFSTFTVFEAEEEESDEVVVPKEEPTEPEEPEVPKEDKDDNDKKEPNDKDTITSLFPKNQGYEISKDNKLISIDLNQQNSETIKLSKEQVQALNTLQTITVYKDGIKLSISTSIFDKNGEEIVISVIQEDTATNSLSNTYNLIIKQGGKVISQFDQGVKLTFDVNVDLAHNPNNLKVFYFNEDTGNWVNIGGQYNKVTKQVSVVTNHFSRFTVFETEENRSSNKIVPIVDSNKSNNQNVEQNKQNNEQVNTALNSVLPNTATNTYNFLLIGGLLLLVGGSIFVSIRFRTRSN